MKTAALFLSLLVLSGVALGDRHLGVFDGLAGWLQRLPWPRLPFAVAPPAACAGFSHGPASVVNIIDPISRESVPELVWTLYLDCGGEVAEGSFPLDSLTSEIGGDGWLASEGFTLRVKGTSQTATYSVVNDGLPVYGAQFFPGFIGITGSAEHESYEESVNTYRAGAPGGSVICEIASRINPMTVARVEATKGHLSSPTVTFEGELEIVTDSGKTARATVGSGMGTAQFVLDNKTVAVAAWNGNLVTGAPAPDPRDVVVIRDLLASGRPWKLASAGAWDNYLGLGETCQVTGSWATSKQAAKVSLVAGGVLFGGGNFNLDQSAYVIDLGRARVAVPVLTLRIRGSLLGVQAAAGVPVLSGVSVQPSELRAGAAGQVAYTVENTAGVEGAFTVSLACAGETIGVEQQLSVSAKGRQSSSYGFSFSSQGTRSCVLSACPRTGDPTTCNRQTVSINVLSPVVCEPGLIRAEGLSVYQCAKDGSGLVEILRCGGTVSQLLAPDPLRRTSDSVTFQSVPQFGGGVWSCTGGEQLVGQSCLVYPSVAESQVEASGCRFVCKIAGLRLPAAISGVTVGAEAVSSQPGTWVQVGCEPPRPPPVILSKAAATPVPSPLLDTPVVAAAAGETAARAPRPPGFEAVFAIVGLLVVGWVAARRRAGRG